jgi:hypothetical protein
MNDTKDFTPTKEQISLHGLGFIQIVMPGNQRLHVWHPELPRRSCFQHSAIHNHRFGFSSRVIVGTQVNRRYTVVESVDGTHDIISHDGPRSPKGGRLSYVSGRCNILHQANEYYEPGQTYHMNEFQYHETPNSGIVVTLMQKMVESTTTHANSIILHGHEFDQSFDRFQLSPDELWAFVLDAMKGAKL